MAEDDDLLEGWAELGLFTQEGGQENVSESDNFTIRVLSCRDGEIEELSDHFKLRVRFELFKISWNKVAIPLTKSGLLTHYGLYHKGVLWFKRPFAKPITQGLLGDTVRLEGSVNFTSSEGPRPLPPEPEKIRPSGSLEDLALV